MAGGRAQGRLALRFRRNEVTGEWAGFADKPGYHDAQAVGHRLAELYEARRSTASSSSTTASSRRSSRG